MEHPVKCYLRHLTTCTIQTAFSFVGLTLVLHLSLPSPGRRKLWQPQAYRISGLKRSHYTTPTVNTSSTVHPSELITDLRTDVWAPWTVTSRSPRCRPDVFSGANHRVSAWPWLEYSDKEFNTKAGRTKNLETQVSKHAQIWYAVSDCRVRSSFLGRGPSDEHSLKRSLL
ncbi:hypothetical protein BDP81DRAFT_452752 [Colletotrichum phormii]|uniref:Uncharacterized protein n=1 Tax=Colletotrichum phormii TaxID=359342 RepID=A0AAJ0EBN8_9PEZI|nr:uncharacterized protein BDP81DRAFT_452752 [Colletotrichum phormii]KAK1625801.1 hypothetical protein BDP81DRAFT_452752 [Colletotrichum phormii]